MTDATPGVVYPWDERPTDGKTFPWEFEAEGALQRINVTAHLTAHTNTDFNLLGDWPHGLTLGDQTDPSILLWFDDPAAVDHLIERLFDLKRRAALPEAIR